MHEMLARFIIPALVGACVAIVGWVVNPYLERREERRRRHEKTRDFQKAIFAEINAYVGTLEHDDLNAYGDAMVQKIEKGTAQKPFVPFIPMEQNDTIFKALVSDIHILPRSVIDPIVLYYSQLVAIQVMVADIRSAGYAKLEKPRRIAMYEDYIAMKKTALSLGKQALQDIKKLDEV